MQGVVGTRRRGGERAAGPGVQRPSLRRCQPLPKPPLRMYPASDVRAQAPVPPGQTAAWQWGAVWPLVDPSVVTPALPHCTLQADPSAKPLCLPMCFVTSNDPVWPNEDGRRSPAGAGRAPPPCQANLCAPTRATHAPRTRYARCTHASHGLVLGATPTAVSARLHASRGRCSEPPPRRSPSRAHLSEARRLPLPNRLRMEREAGSLASREQKTMQKSLVMTAGCVQLSICRAGCGGSGARTLRSAPTEGHLLTSQRQEPPH